MNKKLSKWFKNDERLKKYVEFEGKLFWVDLITPDIRVVNPDGSSRPAVASRDGTLGELLNEGHVVSPPENFKP